MKRRKFIKAGFGVLGAGLLTGLYTWQVEPFWLEFTHHPMPIRGLPAPLKGNTLMQISDVHVGRHVDFNFLESSFKTAQALDPDFVVYTGDYVSYESQSQLEQLKKLSDSAVLGKKGTVAILGNHDYGHNWSQESVASQIVDMLENSGISVLRNQQKDFSGLNVIGIDDFWAINFHPERVMESLNPAIPNLVLCHNPDVLDLPIWNGYQGWVLSGHTHGGQCKPPFLKAPILPVKK